MMDVIVGGDLLERERSMAADLRLAAARHTLGLLQTADVIDLAHQLLDSGIYSYWLGELATNPQPIMSDVNPVFEKALRALGVEKPNEEIAARIVITSYIGQIVEGSLDARTGLYQFVNDFYWRRQFEKGGHRILDALQCWTFVFAYGLFDYSQADPEYRPDLRAAEEQVMPVAKQWLREQWEPLVNPAWRTANVLALAQAIYDERAFERMPIFGDALEEAGCDNADILQHCRAGGEHVRGCWVVDLILGKE
jgi:hypothetical protein